METQRSTYNIHSAIRFLPLFITLLDKIKASPNPGETEEAFVVDKRLYPNSKPTTALVKANDGLKFLRKNYDIIKAVYNKLPESATKPFPTEEDFEKLRASIKFSALMNGDLVVRIVSAEVALAKALSEVKITPGTPDGTPEESNLLRKTFKKVKSIQMSFEELQSEINEWAMGDTRVFHAKVTLSQEQYNVLVSKLPEEIFSLAYSAEAGLTIVRIVSNTTTE